MNNTTKITVVMCANNKSKKLKLRFDEISRSYRDDIFSVDNYLINVTVNMAQNLDIEVIEQ